MPIPTPRPSETENEFISRCVSNEMNKGMTQDQALGACYAVWKEKKMRSEILKNKNKENG